MSIILYNQQLKELDADKDKFIGIASHELKTPLAVIKANLQLMAQQMEEGQPFLGNALRHIEKLSLLISDLLDTTKIQAGKLDLNLERFIMDELLREAIESLRYTETTHEIVLVSGLGDTEVLADRHRIEQVIINLVTNAVKYSPDADKVIIHAETRNGKVIIGVEDFGIGIGEEQQNKIFARFFRVEDLPVSFTGLGMGLYICRQIVERHHGRLWVRSAPGKGSVFYFEIPLMFKDDLTE